jgi:hypothetical protein
MKVAFHSNQLSLRGTEVALYDYAKYNELILGNGSIIISKDNSVWPYSHEKAIKKFKDRFEVYLYKDFKEVEDILNSENIDVFYAQKAGFNDGVISKGRKTVIHSVFQYNEPHGDVYAYISEWLGSKYNKPFVPYMVDLPNVNDNLREYLDIPKNAIVFGRYGGLETFDIEFVQEVVKEVAKKRKDIYFLFMFTNKFTDASISNVIYLDGNHDLNYKVKFINTCDAMLHARKVGETFGLAVAEFSCRNKPIITFSGVMRESAHLQMLGDKSIKYKNKIELMSILNDFKIENKNWNAYTDYNPKEIMKQFNNIFLK